ncbi:MAG: hypothetical protein U0L11_05965 [Acutalibacteraceae bacterium]|nr:hypothetical protein [Acutalibacteraceae bacterium]
MKLNTKEVAVFGMLGAVMFASKMLMEILPNIHLLGTFIVAITVVYRKKALYPIYIYVLLNGIFAGFATWWIPYLYVWTVLWAAIMILPKKMPPKVAPIVYAVVCSLHGFGFGILYAPAQAVIFGLNFKAMLAWIAAGMSFDVIHGISNLCCGILIVPLIKLLKNSEKYTR